ncbi:MAG: hypothetical protein ACR2IV_01350 [Bryobacteraceae bacterium]
MPGEVVLDELVSEDWEEDVLAGVESAFFEAPSLSDFELSDLELSGFGLLA